MRLQKFLSRAGVASRRKAEDLILSGRIAVNGAVVKELGTRVNLDQDEVTVNGEVVALAAVRWVAFFKPKGLLSTESDPHGGRTIYDALPQDFAGLRYVGRLDRDTQGLLLLTNDGDVVYRLTHPSFQVEREYIVWTRDEVAPEQVTRLRGGVELEDGPAKALRVEQTAPRRLSLVLTEGRNQEVRRMMAAVGHDRIDLRRVRYGPVDLGTLQAGEWRDLDASEVAALHHETNTKTDGV